MEFPEKTGAKMQKMHFWEFGNYFSKEKALIKSEPLDLDGWLGFKIPKGYVGSNLGR